MIRDLVRVSTLEDQGLPNVAVNESNTSLEQLSLLCLFAKPSMLSSFGGIGISYF